jgi:malate dehydrogenase (oxaloacetate-decarboxylating)
VESRADLTPEQRVYARAGMTGDGTLSGVIGAIDATILIGLSTAGGAFTEAVVREMARKVERPILLPLSNPTERSEATAAELIHWTGGRALAATGSPFPPVHYNGRSITVAQCNNVYIFPAMGLGAVAAQARRITDSMFLAAARALAACSPALQDPSAPLLPALEDLRRVSLQIAFAAGCEAQRTGHAPRQPAESLMRSIAAAQWTPAYPEF